MIQFSKKYRDYILLFANIAIRLLFVSFPFWGLEYEDAFVYNDTGRYLNHNYDFHSAFFKTQCCIDGSFAKCNEYASYGGHFLTFPVLISKLNLLIGYHPFNVFILNFIFSILLLLIVFIWHKRNKKENQFSLSSFLLLMLLTPFVTVFQTSGLAETLSSLMVILTIIFMLKTSENDFKVSNYSLWFTFLFLIGAVITKRENILLLSLLFLIPIFRFVKKKNVIPSGYLVLLLLSLFTVSFFSHYIDIFSVENNEGADIGTKTFSFTFLVQNLQQTFLAFINFNFWGLTGIIFLLSVIVVLIKKFYSQLSVLCLTVSFLYMLLYSSHYRSYYQVHYNIMHPFETLRYSVTYFPLIAIFISTVDFKKIFSLKQSYAKPIFITSIFVSLILLFNSVKTRIDFSRNEYFSRIEPIEKTLAIVKESDIVITDLPMVFHCYVSDKQRIVDYYSLSQEKLNNLISDIGSNNVYLIKRKENPEDEQRYSLNFDVHQYCFSKITLPIENYELIKFCNNAVKN